MTVVRGGSCARSRRSSRAFSRSRAIRWTRRSATPRCSRASTSPTPDARGVPLPGDLHLPGGHHGPRRGPPDGRPVRARVAAGVERAPAGARAHASRRGHAGVDRRARGGASGGAAGDRGRILQPAQEGDAARSRSDGPVRARSPHGPGAVPRPRGRVAVQHVPQRGAARRAHRVAGHAESGGRDRAGEGAVPVLRRPPGRAPRVPDDVRRAPGRGSRGGPSRARRSPTRARRRPARAGAVAPARAAAASATGRAPVPDARRRHGQARP
jgi:hypothetical protein